VYRKISSELYWGYEEKATRYNKYLIAEPEKALLDWIYLNRQEGLPTPLDELQLQFLTRQGCSTKKSLTVRSTVRGNRSAVSKLGRR